MTKNPKTSMLLAVLLVCAMLELGLCREFGVVTVKRLGGMRDRSGSENDVEIEDLGRFAVQEHNRKSNSLITFMKVLSVQEQVVAGKIYRLTLEASDFGHKKIYEAKIWVKPWMNFKKLEEFKPSPALSADSLFHLGLLRGR